MIMLACGRAGVFPAPAGINRTRVANIPRMLGVPRASGDKPALD